MEKENFAERLERCLEGKAQWSDSLVKIYEAYLEVTKEIRLIEAKIQFEGGNHEEELREAIEWKQRIEDYEFDHTLERRQGEIVSLAWNDHQTVVYNSIEVDGDQEVLAYRMADDESGNWDVEPVFLKKARESWAAIQAMV